MLLLKFLVRFVRLLNSETSAAAIALAFALGVFLGLVPILTLQAFAALLVLMFFRVNMTAAFFSMAVFKLLSLALAGTFDKLGVTLLESPGLAGLHTWLYNSPLSLCGLNHSTTLGATATAALLFVPVFALSWWIVNAYRRSFSEWWTALGIVNAFRGSKIYKIYAWLDSPYEG